MEILATIWLILIIVLWIGYLFLDGFDLGVGMLMPVITRDERRRRVLLNAIGPTWDGNEVWLITAAGAMFAAFPHWYASLFSALYIPLTLCLISLIFRAVSIEYRGKGHTAAWRGFWTWAMALGSLGSAFSIGAMLALTTIGLPLDAHGNIVGGGFAWLSWPVLAGGLGAVAYCVVHGLLFLGLRTDGLVRGRADLWASRLILPAAVPFLVWFALSALARPWLYAVVVLGAAALVGASACVRRGAGAWAFALHGVWLVAGVGTAFAAAYPSVLPSTISPAFDLTVATASSSDYTLTVMLTVTAIVLPIIIAYQIFSYRMVLGRIREEHIPEPHHIPSVIGAS